MVKGDASVALDNRTTTLVKFCDATSRQEISLGKLQDIGVPDGFSAISQKLAGRPEARGDDKPEMASVGSAALP